MTRSGGDDAIEMRIFDAALNLFAHNSYHAVSVPKIADAAGVGVGSIYRLAESKAILAERLYEQVLEGLVTELNAPLDSDAELSREKYFWAYWNRLTEWVNDSPEHLRFILLYSFAGPLRGIGKLDDADSFRLIRDAAVENGWLFTNEPKVLSALIGGALAVLILDLEQGQTPSKHHLSLIGEAVLRALAPSD